MIAQYTGIAPKGDLMLLQKLSQRLRKRSFLHVNSTKEGGGVAEILQRMIPIFQSLDIDARWETITGDAKFFDITKKIHNALQGNMETITDDMWEYHFEVNKRNADTLDLDADAVIIHDPQPGPLVTFKKRGTWLWRCHIDLSNPVRDVSTRLGRYAEKFDAVIFSVARFARALKID
jgi:trehalose synthase